MLEVSCAFIIHDQKILVAQNRPGANQSEKWEFPGGKVENNETPAACIVREIHEELALDIKVVEALRNVEFHYTQQSIRLIPFICIILGGTMQLNDHQATRWLSFGELEETDFAGADRALLTIEANQQGLKKYLRE